MSERPLGSGPCESGGFTDGDTELDLGPGGRLGLSWPVRVVPSWAEWPGLPLPSSISHWMWAASEGVVLGEVRLPHSLEERRVGGGHSAFSAAGTTGPFLKGLWAEPLCVQHRALRFWD